MSVGDDVDRGRSVLRNQSRGGIVNGPLAKSRDGSLSRSQSRGILKENKETVSHAGTSSHFDPPPMGLHSGKYTNGHSPKSSSGALHPQPVNITIIGTPVSETERVHGRERESSRPRDNNNKQYHRVRDGSTDRSAYQDRPRKERERGREHPRHGYERSPSRSPQQTYHHIRKFGPTHSRSRTPSFGHYSDSSSDMENSSSVFSSVNSSVFSAPGHRRRSRASPEAGAGSLYDSQFRSKHHVQQRSPVYREDAFSREGYYPGSNQRTKRYPVDDYPRQPPNPHPLLHKPTTLYSSEDAYDDEGGPGSMSYSLVRRNSAPIPNPFDPVRYPAQRSHSYADYPSTYINPIYSGTKSFQEPYEDSLDVQDILQAGVEALREKHATPYKQILQPQPRPPLMRSNTLSAEAPPGAPDFWANAQYPLINKGYRATKQKIRLRDGLYVDL